MSSEIFRYKHGDLLYIGRKEAFDDFTIPEKYPSARSWWISIAISNASCKKVKGGFNRDDCAYDARIGAADNMGQEGIEMLFDLIKVFTEWIEKAKPKFITVSPYQDFPYKRMKCYDRVLRKAGYIPYEGSYEYDAPVVTYCRRDLNLVEDSNIFDYIDDYFTNNPYIPFKNR